MQRDRPARGMAHGYDLPPIQCYSSPLMNDCWQRTDRPLISVFTVFEGLFGGDLRCQTKVRHDHDEARLDQISDLSLGDCCGTADHEPAHVEDQGWSRISTSSKGMLAWDIPIGNAARVFWMEWKTCALIGLP